MGDIDGVCLTMCSAEEDVTNWDTPAWWRQASRLRQDTAARGRETLAGEEEMVQVACMESRLEQRVWLTGPRLAH